MALDLVERQVDAVTTRVFAHVADDIGELERHAKISRVFERAPVLISEDLGGQQADYARDAVTIQPQRLEIGIAIEFEIHLHAVDDLVQPRLR